MGTEEQKKNGLSRRSFLIGAGAGAVVAAVVVGGVAELTLPGKSSTTTKTITNTATTTVTTTVTGTGTTTAAPVTSKIVTMTVNGVPETFQVQANWTLLEVLRNQLNLFSVHDGCDRGECGACTVILDGMAVNSCQVLAIEADTHSVTTLEGIGTAENLHPLQQAWLTYEASECGFCTPGMVLQAKALLDANPHPTIDQIRAALVGNLCNCGNYKKITNAVASVGGSS